MGVNVFRQNEESSIAQYAEMIYRIAFHQMGKKEDAEDIMQIVLLKFWQSTKSFASKEDSKRFLIRITLNECHSLFRSPWRERRTDFSEYEWEQFLGNERSAEDIALSRQCNVLYNAVMHLPEKYRACTYLYYYEEYSIKEIAEILEQKETTIQTRLMRAREKLQKQLSEKQFL